MIYEIIPCLLLLLWAKRLMSLSTSNGIQLDDHQDIEEFYDDYPFIKSSNSRLLPTPSFTRYMFKNEIANKIDLNMHRPTCYNGAECATRMITAKIYIHDVLYNEIQKKYPGPDRSINALNM